MLSSRSLVNRGLQAAGSMKALESSKPGHEPTDPEKNGNPVFILILFLTFMVFLVVFTMTVYTYAHLLTTLCMVESSSTQTYVPIASVDADDDAPPEYSEDGTPKPADEEINLVRTEPITASIRGTVRHLKTRGGFRSRFRGFWVYVVWGFFHGFAVTLMAGITGSTIGAMIAAVIAELALTNVHMTWIHVVISEPSEKPWYKRMPQPAMQAFKRMAPAVALWAFSSELVEILPVLVTGTFGTLNKLHDPNFHPGKKDAYISASQMLMLVVLRILLFIGIQIPATVTMVRVAASMLPEEDETIVPFDRTFGGRTTPVILGGQGKIGIVEAWKSFNWECRRRLLKMVVKVAGIIIAMYVAFTIVITAEAVLFLGPSLGDLMKMAHAAMSKTQG